MSDQENTRPQDTTSLLRRGMDTTESMLCPPDKVGVVIGKKGWTINDIQEATKAKITINQKTGKGNPRIIYVSGEPESVKEAVDFLRGIISSPAGADILMKVRGKGRGCRVLDPHLMTPAASRCGVERRLWICSRR